MTEDDDTKDLTEKLTDRQLLLDLRRTMGELVERMTELEHRTNPLPPNYDVRFTAMEERLGRMERDIRLLRDDMHNERHERVILDQRLREVEQRPIEATKKGRR